MFQNYLKEVNQIKQKSNRRLQKSGYQKRIKNKDDQKRNSSEDLKKFEKQILKKKRRKILEKNTGKQRRFLEDVGRKFQESLKYDDNKKLNLKSNDF